MGIVWRTRVRTPSDGRYNGRIMRILITGANGQLGRSLTVALAAHDVIPLGHGDLDVSDRFAAEAAIAEHRPQAVIHAAALTDTARCERQPELALAVNAAGTENVARACHEYSVPCFVISTNEVFDGTKGAPYDERDQPRPLNAYARSKLSGEALAIAANPEAVVVRTAWLYGPGGNNFVQKVLNAARAGAQAAFVTDEISSPTATGDLARSLTALIETGSAHGIYHLTNEGEASRYEWACEILRVARVDVAVRATTSAALRADGYDGPLKPASSVLENTRARALGIVLPHWRASLEAYIASLAVTPHEIASDA